jgi:hypothetical protein
MEQLIKHELIDDGNVTNLTLLEAMVTYCHNDIDCRKRQLALYLGETINYDCRGGASPPHNPPGITMSPLNQGGKAPLNPPGDTGGTSRFLSHPCDNCRRQTTPHYHDLSPYLSSIQSLLGGLLPPLTPPLPRGTSPPLGDVVPPEGVLRGEKPPLNHFDPSDLLDQLSSIIPFSRNEIRRLIDHLIVDGTLRLKTIIENHHIIEYYEVLKPITELLLETGQSREIVHFLHRHGVSHPSYRKGSSSGHLTTHLEYP